MGNCGRYAAKFFHEEGAKIIGLVGSSAGIYNPDGFKNPVEAIDYYYANKKSFANYPDAKEIIEGKDECMNICYKECDILLPCAIENSFNVNNASKV